MNNFYILYRNRVTVYLYEKWVVRTHTWAKWSTGVYYDVTIFQVLCYVVALCSY